MKKVLIKISVAIFLVSAFVPFLSHAQEAVTLQTAKCSDFYKFNSVSVEINPEMEQALAGAQSRFFLEATNSNDYPIVDGSIFVRFFKKKTGTIKPGESNLITVDQFFAKEGITLKSKETKKFDILWTVPAWAPAGDYVVFTYFESAKKFDLGGVASEELTSSRRASFKVVSDFKDSILLDSNGVKLNGKSYLKTTSVDKDGKAEFEIPIKNYLRTSEEVTITYELYNKDNLDSARRLDSKTEKVTLKPLEAKNLVYEISDARYPLYHLVVKASWHDFSSEVNLRLGRNGVSRPLIYFAYLDAFTADNKAKVGVCLLNQGNPESTTTVKLNMSVLGQDGASVKNLIYAGDMDPARATGLTANFDLGKNFDKKLKLKASLSDTSGKEEDSFSIDYDCGKIDPATCPKEAVIQGGDQGQKNNFPINPLLAGGIILGIAVIAVVVVVIKKKHGQDNLPPNGEMGGDGNQQPPSAPGGTTIGVMILLLSAVTFITLGINHAEAKSFSFFHPRYPVGDCPKAAAEALVNFTDVDAGYGGNTAICLENYYQFTYNFYMKNETTGTLLNDGATVKVGDRVAFYYNRSDFDAGGANTVEWIEETYGYKTHPGFWQGDVSAPQYPYASPDTCNVSDLYSGETNTIPSGPNNIMNVYLPLVATIPLKGAAGGPYEIIFSAVSGLGDCIYSDMRSRYTCIVNRAGPTRVSIRIESSNLAHFINYERTSGPVSGICRFDPITHTLADFEPAALISLNLTGWAPPQCSDGADNDGDTKVDFPADPGCADANDNNETDPLPPPPQCSDTNDNDADGKIDTADPGCHTDGNAGNAASYDPNDISELDPGVDPQCSDNQDNDLDGKFDWDGMGLPEGPDPGCTDANDNSEQDTPPAGYIIPAPTITGPATGTPGTPYAFTAQSAVPTGGPTGRNYRYGFDWNRDNVVDFWTARAPDGIAGPATFTWATVGSKIFGVIAEDLDYKRSTWSYHAINISNDGSGVCVPFEFWTSCTKPCGGGTQNKLNSCTFEILAQKPCNTRICGTIIREVPP